MNVHPAAVAAAVEIHQRVARGRPERARPAVEPEIVPAVQRGRGPPDVDARPLGPAAAELPEIRHRHAAGGQRDRGRLADREAVAEDRVTSDDRRLHAL